MGAALFWVLLFVGVLITFPIGWRFGYRAGRADYSELPATEWDGHVDQALSVFEERAAAVTRADWEAAMQRHPSNVSYLRSRRDKIT